MSRQCAVYRSTRSHGGADAGNESKLVGVLPSEAEGEGELASEGRWRDSMAATRKEWCSKGGVRRRVLDTKGRHTANSSTPVVELEAKTQLQALNAAEGMRRSQALRSAQSMGSRHIAS